MTEKERVAIGFRNHRKIKGEVGDYIMNRIRHSLSQEIRKENLRM